MNQLETRGYRVPQVLHSPPIAIIVVAVLYAAVAQAGYMITTLPGHIAPIFPSAGIALAAVFILGRPALAGVWLGSFLANLIPYVLSPSLHVSALQEYSALCIIGIGAMASAGAGAFLIRRYCRNQHPLRSVRNLLVLVIVGSLGCCMISPTIGTLTLALLGTTPWELFGYSWLTWWIGDAAGALIAAPLILAWLHQDPFRKSLWRTLEAAVLGGAYSCFATWSFTGIYTSNPALCRCCCGRHFDSECAALH